MYKFAVLFILATITLATTAAHAQSYGFTTVEFQVEHDLETVSTVNGLWGKSLWGPIGLETFVLLTEGWGEAYAGPTVTPIKGLTMGLSAGVQLVGGEFEPRFATSIIGGVEGFSFLGIVEWDTTGVDGVWYKLIASYQATSWLQVGAEARRFAGVGPRVAVTIPHTPLSLWTSWVPVEPEVLDGSLLHWSRFLAGTTVAF